MVIIKVQNTLAPTAQKKLSFSAAITGDALQNLIRKAVPTAEASARLTATLISAVSANPKLQDCEPAQIVAAALRGEGEGLVYEREYSIVPFGTSAVFVRGWRGYLSLLYATGEIADTECFDVREGELVGRDRRTMRPLFDFSKYATDEERYQHSIIGYYFFVEYLNGRFVYDYMSVDEILHHADTYVSYFSLALYNRWRNGEKLTDDEFKKFRISYDALMRLRRTGEGTNDERKAAKDLGAWYDEGMGQVAMMKKTVILHLLRSGRVRLANSAAIRSAISYDGDADVGTIANVDVSDYTVDGETGEVVDANAVPVQEPPKEETPVQESTEKPKRGRLPKSRFQEIGENDGGDNEAIESFFAGAGAK